MKDDCFEKKGLTLVVGLSEVLTLLGGAWGGGGDPIYRRGRLLSLSYNNLVIELYEILPGPMASSYYDNE